MSQNHAACQKHGRCVWDLIGQTLEGGSRPPPCPYSELSDEPAPEPDPLLELSKVRRYNGNTLQKGECCQI